MWDLQSSGRDRYQTKRKWSRYTLATAEQQGWVLWRRVKEGWARLSGLDRTSSSETQGWSLQGFLELRTPLSHPVDSNKGCFWNSFMEKKQSIFFSNEGLYPGSVFFGLWPQRVELKNYKEINIDSINDNNDINSNHFTFLTAEQAVVAVGSSLSPEKLSRG